MSRDFHPREILINAGEYVFLEEFFVLIADFSPGRKSAGRSSRFT